LTTEKYELSEKVKELQNFINL
jgi:hypothetical protein